MVSSSKISILEKVEDLFTISSKSNANEANRKILIIGPEVSPYANVGGAAQVLGSLAKALFKQGHDVRLFMPKFGFIDDTEYPMEMIVAGLEVPTDNPEKPVLICNVKSNKLPSRPITYFLENREYYELRQNVYGYSDDPIRWALLCRGALEFFLKTEDWIPDVIHCNDWQIGYLPNYLKTKYQNTKLSRIATVFTIHNLNYQGMFDHRILSDLEYDDGRSEIANLFDERLLKQNFMRRGIMYADVVNTVSENYAKEIQKPEFGEKLDRLLTEVRAKTSGILNGIDFEQFNPATDKLIPVNYTSGNLAKRIQNKAALQKEFDLVSDLSVPLIGYVGRISDQKGIDLLLQIMPSLMRDFKVQFVFVGGVAGGGDSSLATQIKSIQEKYPDMVGAHLMLDFDLSHLVFAGADIVAVPSRFEPCGLVPMEAMRYGAIPLVHGVGGLIDSVKPYDYSSDSGFGFVFKQYDPYSLFGQIVRALEIYKDIETWTKLQKIAMSQDNSWLNRASNYVDLYDRASQITLRRLEHEGKIE